MKKLWNWIMSIFTITDAFLKKTEPVAEKSVEAVNIVKDLVEGKLTDLAKLTPSDKDDALMFRVKNILVNKIIPEMVAAEGIISAGKPIEALVQYLSAKPKLGRVKWWLELAGQIIMALADGNLSIGEAISIGQAIFSKLFGK